MKNQAMYDGLIERRSIRSFKPEQVSDEDLQAVLKAGTYAPTAMGAQAPIIIAVQNPEDVRRGRHERFFQSGRPAEEIRGRRAPRLLVHRLSEGRDAF